MNVEQLFPVSANRDRLKQAILRVVLDAELKGEALTKDRVCAEVPCSPAVFNRLVGSIEDARVEAFLSEAAHDCARFYASGLSAILDREADFSKRLQDIIRLQADYLDFSRRFVEGVCRVSMIKNDESLPPLKLGHFTCHRMARDEFTGMGDVKGEKMLTGRLEGLIGYPAMIQTLNSARRLGLTYRELAEAKALSLAAEHLEAQLTSMSGHKSQVPEAQDRPSISDTAANRRAV